MTRSFFAACLPALLLSGNIAAQCAGGKSYNDIETPCYKQFTDPAFITDGQDYREILSGGTMAEYSITFFAGNTYRIITCSSLPETPLTYYIVDPQGKVIFDNSKHDNARVWDIEFKSTITCWLKFHFAGQKPTERTSILNPLDTIEDSLRAGMEAKMKKEKKEAVPEGCASVMISFKQ